MNYSLIKYRMISLVESDFNKIRDFIIEITKDTKHIVCIKSYDELKSIEPNKFYFKLKEDRIEDITLWGEMYRCICETLNMQDLSDNKNAIRLHSVSAENSYIDYYPGQAKNIFYNKLQKYYTIEEIHNILKSVPYPDYKQKAIHYRTEEKGKVLKFENCIYLDMNKAHSYVMSQLFPKAMPMFEELAKKGKIDKKYKNVVNYAVGYLNHKNGNDFYYPNVYEYIVYTIAKTITDKANELTGPDSTIVYVNTDGIVIQNPTQWPEDSQKFGEFKRETKETTFYTYRGDNYWMLQYGDTKKGNLPASIKEHIDLRENKTPKIKKVLNKETKIFEYEVEEDEDRI